MISSFGSVESHSPDLIYYNCSIINANYTDNGSPNPAAQYSEYRTIPIVPKAEDYEMSVIRMTTESGLNLPILIFQANIGQSDPNQGIYSITINATFNYTVGGNSGSQTLFSQQFLEWVPENQNAPSPSAPLQQQDLVSEYYWLFTYSHFCDIVNTAFKSALADLQTQFTAWVKSSSGLNQEDAPTLTTKAPYITYDATTSLFTIYYDTYGYGGADRTSAGSLADENMTLYFDSNLFALLGNFNALYVGNDTMNGMTYQMVVQNMNDTNIYTSSVNFYKMVQDYNSLSNIWSPISGICFCTTLIPCEVEFASNPITFDSSNIAGAISSNNNFENIITDIQLPLDKPSDWRTFINYTPQGEYRMISLSGGQPISNIDVRMYYRLKMTNQLILMTMPNQSAIYIKLMFRKKYKF